MAPEAFRTLLDACGGAPEHWPPGARAGAERLLAVSQIARDALRTQQEIDRWLVATGEMAALPDFAARAMKRRQLAPVSSVQRALVGGSRGAMAAAAALLAVGLGTATGFANGQAGEPAQVLAAALSTSGDAPDAD